MRRTRLVVLSALSAALISACQAFPGAMPTPGGLGAAAYPAGPITGRVRALEGVDAARAVVTATPPTPPPATPARG